MREFLGKPGTAWTIQHERRGRYEATTYEIVPVDVVSEVWVRRPGQKWVRYLRLESGVLERPEYVYETYEEAQQRVKEIIGGTN